MRATISSMRGGAEVSAHGPESTPQSGFLGFLSTPIHLFSILKFVLERLPLRDLHNAPPPAPSTTRPLPLPELATPGRIVELCGKGAVARMTTAVAIVAHVQREGDTAAWIQPRPETRRPKGPTSDSTAAPTLFPPDLERSGIDLEALVVANIPCPPPNSAKKSTARSSVRSRYDESRERHARQSAEQCRAAELLLRSGAFGLVVIDLTNGPPKGPPASWQGRLLGLARQYGSRLVLLTSHAASDPSLGPLVGLRVVSRLRRLPAQPERPQPSVQFFVDYEILKNKSGGPLETISDLRRGPWGLR